AGALMWCSRSETVAPLRAALQHADTEVKLRAAIGLAFLGDASVSSVVRSEMTGTIVTPTYQFAAMLALGELAGTATTVFLDHPEGPIRTRALLTLMLLELKDTDGVPEKCLDCLSAKGPRFRLTGARALEAFADPAAFKALVVELVDDRGED